MVTTPNENSQAPTELGDSPTPVENLSSYTASEKESVSDIEWSLSSSSDELDDLQKILGPESSELFPLFSEVSIVEDVWSLFEKLEVFQELKQFLKKEREDLSKQFEKRQSYLTEKRKSASQKLQNKFKEAQDRIRKRKERIGEQFNSAKGSLKQRREKLKSNFETQRERVKKAIREPFFVRTIDKFAFIIGIINMIVTEYFLLQAPQRLWQYYLVLIGPLLVLRYWLYRRAKFHYFMYDFCYFAQILLLISLLFVPSNQALQRVNFAIANGPLAWAIVLWRNSLVFHSLDKMTSIFIHVFPPLVTFCLRWYPQETRDLDNIGTCRLFVDMVWFPFLLYLLWQSLYLLKTEWFSRNKLKRDPDLMTSFRYLTKERNSLSFKVISMFGESHQLSTFVGLQLAYTLLTLVFSSFLYKSQWLHIFFLFSMAFASLWNGASYYFDIFALRYMGEILTRTRSPTTTRSTAVKQ
eukprot:jgi/Galph1/2170/GphlegSOOS_G858.1